MNQRAKALLLVALWRRLPTNMPDPVKTAMATVALDLESLRLTGAQISPFIITYEDGGGTAHTFEYSIEWFKQIFLEFLVEAKIPAPMEPVA